MGLEVFPAKEDETEEMEEEEEEEDQVVVLGSGEMQEREASFEQRTLKARPSILLVGPSAVGKRALLKRLIGRGRSVRATSESGRPGHGWTIDTKYYTANVCLWTARLGDPSVEDAESINSEFGCCEALVMVFDLSAPNSLEQLQEWVGSLKLGSFEILLCVGNKADRVPEHFGHVEYSRKLQKKGESFSDPFPDFADFGIDRAEGSSLLPNEGAVSALEDRRRSCVEWCSEIGVEYIEACAINEVFDECMSVDGDLQGVARIRSALSAHMWPGLVMKDEIEGSQEPSSSAQQEMTSDDDSDYYIEYELLSNGSAEPWEASGWEEDQWSFSTPMEEGAPQPDSSIPPLDKSGTPAGHPAGQQVAPDLVTDMADKSPMENHHTPTEQTDDTVTSSHVLPEASAADKDGPVEQKKEAENKPGRSRGQKYQEYDDIEKLMGEMANMRTNMRSMSDHHRREMAAKLAMRMASMFDEDEQSTD